MYAPLSSRKREKLSSSLHSAINATGMPGMDYHRALGRRTAGAALCREHHQPGARRTGRTSLSGPSC